jgi:hypothetical protein
MKLPKITEPNTDNKERAFRADNRREGSGSPSRAHPHKEKVRHSKKPGGTIPKQGGRSRG